MDKLDRSFSPDLDHEEILRTRKPLLSFNENNDYESWREKVKERLTDLLGMPEEKCDPRMQIEWEKDQGDFIEKRFIFYSEPQTKIPCHLWIPKKAKKPCPVVICLQGHSTGMHISMGRQIHEKDFKNPDGRFMDRDIAVQAIEQGYAALIMEQRGFGERISEKSAIFDKSPEFAQAIKDFWYSRTGCYHPSMVAILLGRTLIGERIWDISRAIDLLPNFHEIDTERIACTGNSGGGTATYYAACMEERIKIAMPCCSVCNFIESIGIMRHCSCNYIPRIAKYFDMGDISTLIAPRKLIMISGKQDIGFYIKGSYDAYATIEKIFKKAGVPDNCKLVVGEEGHRFYKDPSWDVFAKLSGWREF